MLQKGCIKADCFLSCTESFSCLCRPRLRWQVGKTVESLLNAHAACTKGYKPGDGDMEGDEGVSESYTPGEKGFDNCNYTREELRTVLVADGMTVKTYSVPA
jgi:hypothetical protein